LRRDGRAAGPPRVRLTKEDVRRINERFGQLERDERRAIVRAVNRGTPMARRRDAEIAVGVARRQQRFWSRAWVMGPGIALLQMLVTPIGLLEGLLLAAWGTLLLGMLAALWWTRARRAELENLRVIGGRSSEPSSRAVAQRPRSRLPGGPVRHTSDGTAGEPSTGTTARPPRPRGRKRR
jgi:hypothetical protein